MRQDNSTANSTNGLRYGMINPIAFFVASIITACLSYSDAKRVIADDFIDAMLALANENSALWTLHLERLSLINP